MKEIDVRGLSCPEPVLMLKEALEANKNDTYKILANEAHTVKNLKNSWQEGRHQRAWRRI